MSFLYIEALWNSFQNHFWLRICDTRI